MLIGIFTFVFNWVSLQDAHTIDIVVVFSCSIYRYIEVNID